MISMAKKIIKAVKKAVKKTVVKKEVKKKPLTEIQKEILSIWR
jgi:hypothetical protein